MSGLVTCPACRSQLVPPPNAPVISCGICGHAVSVPRGAVPAVAPPYSSGYAAPQTMPPPAAGSRRALLVGINYNGTANQLGGCINDVRCMSFLLKKHGFNDSEILMLTEDNPNRIMHPTRANIINGMRWLIGQPRAGDSLFFQFSGHGGQTRARQGDERDGLNETILPLDFRSAGCIEDDEINQLLVNPLPPGCRLHAVVDACHSGSVMDLPFTLREIRGGRADWLDESRFSRVYKGTAGGMAICFSACDDSQTSADTSALSKVTRTGAMTFCFIEALESGHGATYGSIMERTRWRLQTAGGTGAGGGGLTFGGGFAGGVAGDLLGMLLGSGSYRPSGGFSQIPQLSASQPFDVNMPFHL